MSVRKVFLMIPILVGQLANGQWFASCLQIVCMSATREEAREALRLELKALKLADEPVTAMNGEGLEL